MSQTLESRLTIQLRWRDMDMLGHLNQSVYHELLEDARAGFLIELAGAAGGETYGTYVVVRVELDYRHEVRKDAGTVEVLVRVARVGRKSVTLDHEVLLPDGTVAAAGLTVMVGWDGQARGARELSDAERAALEADA